MDNLTVVVGFAPALVLILSSLGLIDTTRILLARQFGEIQRQDARVVTAGQVDQDTLGRIAAVPGVAVVEPAPKLAVSLRHGDRTYATALIGLQADTSMHRFSTADGMPRNLPESGILAVRALGDRLGVSPGDTVVASLPDGDSTFDETLTGFADEALGTYAYVALPRSTAGSARRFSTPRRSSLCRTPTARGCRRRCPCRRSRLRTW